LASNLSKDQRKVSVNSKKSQRKSIKKS